MSTVIKATDRHRAVQGVAFNVDDVARNAEAWLQKVREEAGRILAKAQQEADAIRKQAEADGRQAGLKHVEQLTEREVARQMQTTLPMLERAIVEIEQSKQAWLGHWERQAIHLSCGIAARVIRRELAKAPDISLALVREALELCSAGSQLRIHVNPQDLSTLKGQLTGLLAQFTRLGPAEFIPDPQVTSGGCRIETSFGAVDQRFEEQLARIEEELTETMLDLGQQLATLMPTRLEGSVVRTVGMTAAVADFPAPVGALVAIERQSGGPLEAEVVGFRDRETIVFPLADMQGVRHGNRVRLVRTKSWLRVGRGLLGRVIDARGKPIDGRPPPLLTDRMALDGRPPSPLERPRIDAPLSTGIRAIDGLLTCGKGQRMGIFAGSGVGKSVLLGMMSRYTSADVNVIALIGERGREVNEFLERDLGPAGLARSVVVVATSDEPALVRTRAAFVATALAEYFRDQGRDVLLVMDSLTRFALAQREIGLAAGEPPTTRGYPPSVFALLPKLVERAGRSADGSITAFYSVLVEGDDPNEPIADAVRGLIDGHTWLSRKIAAKNHYPAIDVLESLSRLMSEVASPEHREAAGIVRELLAAHRDHEDLISIGAYRRGSNRVVDLAIEMLDGIHEFLRQRVEESSTVATAAEGLLQLRQRAVQKAQQIAKP